MAKKSKNNKLKKSITSEELQDLQNLVKTINSFQMELGSLELKKQSVFAKVEKASELLVSLQNSLELIYGEVNIDINTGEITAR